VLSISCIATLFSNAMCFSAHTVMVLACCFGADGYLLAIKSKSQEIDKALATVSITVKLLATVLQFFTSVIKILGFTGLEF
jgi:uncharacterized membrane protein